MNENSIEYYGPDGRVLRFFNADELYPVNRYQSLVLADGALNESMQLAACSNRRLDALRAIEICCGGGAAAIGLKAAGVGHVQACDVNPRAVQMCRHNAEANGLQLDDIRVQDVLGGAGSWPEERFDLVACNPPCADSKTAASAPTVHLRRAVDGGRGGIEPLLQLIDNLPGVLNPGGRFVFVLTSTMLFTEVFARIQNFAWHFARGTPLAQPYAKAATPRGQELLAAADRKEVFVWTDGEKLWRLTWIVAVDLHSTTASSERRIDDHGRWPKLFFTQSGYDVDSPSYRSLLSRWTA